MIGYQKTNTEKKLKKERQNGFLLENFGEHSFYPGNCSDRLHRSTILENGEALWDHSHQSRSCLMTKKKERKKNSFRFSFFFFSIFFLQKTKGAISLSSHESTIADGIIAPDDIPVSFEEIGGLESAKTELRDSLILPLTRPELCANNSLHDPPRGILLYGPPGTGLLFFFFFFVLLSFLPPKQKKKQKTNQTGKTMLAKAIAKECGCYFISLCFVILVIHPTRQQKNLNQSKFDFFFADVQIEKTAGVWLGETEKLTAAMFSLAKKLQPCVLFIDEIDAVLGRRRDPRMHEVYHKQISIMLSNWDGLVTKSEDRIVIIGTTNNKSYLDSAVLRRMPIQVLVPLPDKKQREQILKIVLKNETLDSTVSISEIAALTKDYSGSDLFELCKRAAKLRLRRLADAHEKISKGLKNNTEESDDDDDDDEADDFAEDKKAKVQEEETSSEEDQDNYEAELEGVKNKKKNGDNSKIISSTTTSAAKKKHSSNDDAISPSTPLSLSSFPLKKQDFDEALKIIKPNSENY